MFMNSIGRLAVWVALMAIGAAMAQPFVPASDDAIVERLPGRPDAELRARRAALARDPQQLALALSVAQRSIERARLDGDPRELGAAQAALAPWWDMAEPPAPVRLLRATILQSRHAFDAALGDLDRLVGDDVAPALRAQALLTRASLLQLLGRLEAARGDCAALGQPAFEGLGRSVGIAAEACAIELMSLTGDPQRARQRLDVLAARAGPSPWLALLQAELAERLGDDAATARHYAAAAASGGVYVIAAWADWLLDRGRPSEALDVLVRGPTEADALLLRRAIAWHRLADPRAIAARAALGARFAAARQRGDPPHLREEARAALDLEGDPVRALELARAQWDLQKEPADAVLLWRAAQRAGRPASAMAIRSWVRDPARTDVRLAGLPAAPGSAR